MMLYTVSLKPDEEYEGKCLLGAFLMREDAEMFMDKHYMGNEHLVLDEVDGVWKKWQGIRGKLEETEKEAA
jgi:hypothetical protein